MFLGLACLFLTSYGHYKAPCSPGPGPGGGPCLVASYPVFNTPLVLGLLGLTVLPLIAVFDSRRRYRLVGLAGALGTVALLLAVVFGGLGQRFDYGGRMILDLASPAWILFSLIGLVGASAVLVGVGLKPSQISAAPAVGP